MDRSYPYSRRLAQRTHRQKCIATLVAFGAAGSAILYAWTAPAPLVSGEAAPAALVSTASVTRAADILSERSSAVPRRIYPYSIVPGGVSDADELRRVIREDKVVAAHYAEFDLSKAHEKTVTTPRAVHVSYRKGDKVYWTAKKIMLAEGETLLSDGSHEARARCANQISDTPRLPVEAHGPSAEELDSSVVDNGTNGNFENVAAAVPADGGMMGGFLNAPGTGTAGGILAGGGGLETGSLFAASANVAPATNGAFLLSRSGSGGYSAGQTGGDGAGSGSDSGGAGDGASGGSGTGNPVGSVPVSSAPGAGTPSTGSPDPAPAPAPQAGTPQPSAPGNLGTPTAPTTSIGGAPSTPSSPDQNAPATPDGGNEAGGGAQETPSAPSPGGGASPPAGGAPVNPGAPESGPGSTPAPQPTLDAPGDPTPPHQEPAKPAEVPEPGTAWLVGAALALMLVLRRKRR